MSLDEVVEILNRILDNQDAILKILTEGQFKPMSQQVEQTQLGSPKTWQQALEEKNIDVNLLDWTQDESNIMPKKWMGDLWGVVNETLRGFGYTWMKDGKESHWSASGQPREQPRQQRDGQQDFTIKDPDSPATEGQLNYIRTLGGTPSPNLTKQQASDVIQNLLNYGDKTPKPRR